MTPGARTERAALLRLAVPLIAQQLGFQLMGNVDAALLGHYSDVALAAAGIGNNLLFALSALGWGIVLGLDTVVPQALGAGRPLDARRALGAGLRLALLTGLGCTLLAIGLPLLLPIAGVPDDVAAGVRIYIDLRALGIVLYLLSIALRSYLAAHNVTRPLLIAVAIANVANAGLDVLLIFGAGPIPALGIAGAAIATLSVQLAIVVVYFVAANRLDGGEPRPPSTRADLLAIVRYGLPVAGHLIAEIGVFAVATMLAAHLGTVPSAAHAVVLTLSSFTFSLAVGIGSATSVRVGHAIGGGQLALARQRGRLGLELGLVAMACFAAAFLLAPDALIRLFTDEPAVIAAAIPLLHIAALFQLSDGTQAIAAGALRGLGDTRATFVANLVGHYALGLPVMLVLGFAVGLGARGLWWGLSAGLTSTAIFLVLRFHARTKTTVDAHGSGLTGATPA